MISEQFKIIPGYEPYEISNLGRLRRKGKVLTTPSSKVGYYRKCLKDLKKNLLIHRAIALCFVPNPNNYPEVNHIDGNKSNNRIENLEWVTRKQNAIHAYKTGLMHDQNGEKGPRAKLSAKEVLIIREALSVGFGQTKIANYFKVDPSTINLIHKRVNWTNI